MPLASFVSQAKARRPRWRMIHHLQIHLQLLTRRCQVKGKTSYNKITQHLFAGLFASYCTLILSEWPCTLGSGKITWDFNVVRKRARNWWRRCKSSVRSGKRHTRPTVTRCRRADPDVVFDWVPQLEPATGLRSSGRSWLHGFHLVSSCSSDYSMKSIG